MNGIVIIISFSVIGIALLVILCLIILLQKINKRIQATEGAHAVKDFAEKEVKPLIDELVGLMFDDDRGKCMAEQCHKPDSTPCGADICIEENKQLWKGKVDKLIEKVYGNEKPKLSEISAKPKVITLCGSTKFKAEFESVNRELTLAGNIVISVACFGHSGDTFTDEQKVLLDEIHKRKIDLADAIFVINKGGYIGASTASEIKYANAHGKEIIYMEAQEQVGSVQ